jgi:hypothetical protein
MRERAGCVSDADNEALSVTASAEGRHGYRTITVLLYYLMRVEDAVRAGGSGIRCLFGIDAVPRSRARDSAHNFRFLWLQFAVFPAVRLRYGPQERNCTPGQHRPTHQI